MTNDEIRLKIAEAKGWIIKQRYPLVAWPDDGRLHGWTDFTPDWPTDPAATLGLVAEGDNHWEIGVSVFDD